ncbi:integrase, catalytic region, zinc finger, CCHC-type containing protein [Tanacetum coccineum]
MNNNSELPQMHRNKLQFQDAEFFCSGVRGKYNANNQGRPFQRNTARGNVVTGNAGGQNRDGNVNLGQAKPIMCYNCKGIGHIARECPNQSVLRIQTTSKTRCLAYECSIENGIVLDEEAVVVSCKNMVFVVEVVEVEVLMLYRSVVSVTLEGTLADAVRALKIWHLRVSGVKLFIPSRGSRNSKRSLSKAFVRISAS